MMRIRINTRGNYYVTPIFEALALAKEQVGFALEDSRELPSYAVEVNGRLLAYIAHGDGHGLNNGDHGALKENEYKLIFKFHYSPSHDYGAYQDRVVPCGLYRWWTNYRYSPRQILNMTRNIDVMARMRTHAGKIYPYQLPWIRARESLVRAAIQLRAEGYNTRMGIVGRDFYANELLHTKLAFIWKGTSYLGWKIPEFLQQGVVMITQPLGEEHPLRDDVVLEDGIHCVFCDNPDKFKETAKSLLSNSGRMESIRANIVRLWEEKLSPVKMAEWYYKKLSELEG